MSDNLGGGIVADKAVPAPASWDATVGELTGLLARYRSEESEEELGKLRYRTLSMWRVLVSIVLTAAREQGYPHEIEATVEFLHQALLALQGLQTVDVTVHSPRHVEVHSVVRQTEVRARVIRMRPDQYVLEMSLVYSCPSVRGMIEEPVTRRPVFLVEFSPRHAFGCLRQSPSEGRPRNTAYTREFTDKVIYSDWLQLRLFMQRALRDYRECIR